MKFVIIEQISFEYYCSSRSVLIYCRHGMYDPARAETFTLPFLHTHIINKMDFYLRCNSLKCRAQLKEQAVVTTCS